MTERPLPEMVTLVIPARNAARTIRPCLDGAVPLLETGVLTEIIVVNDDSTDDTQRILSEYPVRELRSPGAGAALARNIGWHAVRTPIVWFVDADCVVQPNTLSLLLERLDEPGRAGIGGSYSNGCPHSMLASLIHQEIMVRHARMSGEVNHLATYNVVYRRDVLEEVGGFDPACFWAHDVELSYRVRAAGHRLEFEPKSHVAHFHPEQLLRYLRKQFLQGHYRAKLYERHPRRMTGDSYTRWDDIIHPPLALCALSASPIVPFLQLQWVAVALWSIVAILALPMSFHIVRRTGRYRDLVFVPLSVVRAVVRGCGLLSGLIVIALSHFSRRISRVMNWQEVNPA